MKKDFSDIELIQQAQAGDQLAYSELLARYEKSVYYLILKIVKNTEDAEDLCLLTFSKAFTNLDKYRPTHRFATWIFRVASNTSIDFLRKKTIQTVGIAQGDEAELGEVLLNNTFKSQGLTPEEVLIKKQRTKVVHQVLKHLNEDMGKVIKLRFLKEYSYDEISQELNIPLGTVKVQIHRAKKILYSILKDSSETL